VVRRLALEVGQAGTELPGRDDEEGQEDQRQQGDLPRQEEHDAEGQRQGDEVADHVGQGPGERPLRPDDVVVQPADQRSRAGAGEERHRHALHVAEHRPAQVEDEPLADAGRLPPLGDADAGVEQGDGGDEQRQADDPLLAPLLDEGVDHLAGQDRRGHREHGGDGAEAQEGDERPPVRGGELPDPAQGGATDRPLLRFAVHGALERHPVAEVHLHCQLPQVQLPGSHRRSSTKLEVKPFLHRLVRRNCDRAGLPDSGP
jgi:hypothetical protein